MIEAKASERKVRELIPEGSYLARVVGIVHVGTIPGFEGRLQNKVRITFELPTETKVFDKEKGEQPLVKDKKYTLSYHELANLRKLVDACDPGAVVDEGSQESGYSASYDIEELMGKTCQITIEHSEYLGNKYEKISNESQVLKGTTVPDQVNDFKILNYTNFDEELFESLPDFKKDEIKSSEEYMKMKGIMNPPAPDIKEGDNPF